MSASRQDIGPGAAVTPREPAAPRRLLPEGRLPEGAWWPRHRGIVLLLWVHAVVIPCFALARGYSLWHSVLESAIVPAMAIAASSGRIPRRARSAAASVGLLSSSAVLVHLSGGVIEMHFHFFVMVVVIALYQDWIPFLAAIAYVFVHHGLLGAVDPSSVYNHLAAQRDPWTWAGIHAFFITWISTACLVTWRLNETILARQMRAEDQLRAESHVVETLHDVGASLAAELEVEHVVQKVTDAATELTHADFGAFFYNTVDEAGESYVLYTISGVPADAFAKFPLPRNTDLFGPTFRGEGVVRIDDVRTDPRYGKNEPYHGMPPGHLPVRSYLAVPVRSRTGDVLGGLFFGHAEPGMFTETDERIVVGIAAHASIAIDNARLYESEREAREASERAAARLTILADASRVLTSSLDVDALLHNLSRLVVPTIADICVIDVREEDGSIRRAVATGSDEIGPLPPQIRDRPPDGYGDHHPSIVAIRTGQTQLIPEVDRSWLDRTIVDPEHRDAIERVMPRSAVVVPLAGRDEVFAGMLLSTTPVSGRTIVEGDLQLIEELARRAANAIENARLYARQRTAAEILQHSLLPGSLPDLPGVTTTARYLAGGPGLDVGGDWYDVFEVPDGSLVLVMGDVVGRGVEAASLMGQLRNALRAYALEGHKPAETVRRLNDYIHELGPSENMATVVVANFDPETSTLLLTNAGHPPPLLLGPDRSVTLIEEGASIPVGALPLATYPQTSVEVGPGETVLLYTDGIIEDRGLSIDDGLDRLVSACRAAPDDLEGFCDHVLTATLIGRRTDDDIALLALRSVPLEGRLQMSLPARPGILKPLRAALRRWLAAAGATPEESFEILVATGEACTNAIQHATGAAAQSFDLEVQHDGDVHIVVRDHGRWRQPRVDDGGRGLMIMREFMDGVDVVTGEEGTEVRMRRALMSHAGAR